MNPERLRRRARQAQAGARTEQGRISRGGVDPDYIQRLEHFPGFSHEEIYAHVQAMDPGAMQEQAAVWVSIADNLTGAVTGLHNAVQAALGEGLRGHIATAADQAARDFARWATDVMEIAHSTGHRMLAAAYGAEAVRRTVPPPVATGSDPMTPYFDMVIGGAAPGDAHSREAAREEAYRVALAALEANYVPTYPPAGSGVPAFAKVDAGGGAVDVGSPAGPDSTGVSALLGNTTHRADPVTSGGAVSYDGPRSGDASTSGGTTTDAAGSGDRDESTDVRGATTPDASNNTGAQSVQDTNPSTSSAADTPYRDTTFSTKPASTPDAATPQSPLTPYRPYNPATPGSPSSPGSPGRAPSAADPGRSFPAPPAAKVPSAQPLSTTRPGSPAMGLLPGVHPSGGRGTTDSDSTHRTPDWLVRSREQELLGTPPPAVPAVLGAEFPSAHTDLTADPA